MKKKYIIGIIIVAVILIGTGVLTQVFSTKGKKNNNEPSIIDKRSFYDEITGRHCVGSLCIDTVSIEYLDDNTGSLGFVLINTDEVNAQIGGNFIFTPDSSSPLIVYFNELQPGDMQYVKVDFSDKNVTKMKDYTLSDLIVDGNEEV